VGAQLGRETYKYKYNKFKVKNANNTTVTLQSTGENEKNK